MSSANDNLTAVVAPSLFVSPPSHGLICISQGASNLLARYVARKSSVVLSTINSLEHDSLI